MLQASFASTQIQYNICMSQALEPMDEEEWTPFETIDIEDFFELRQ